LSINGQLIRVIQNDAFENVAFVGKYVGFGEKFEFVANELDAFSVCAIHLHHIFVYIFLVFVY